MATQAQALQAATAVDLNAAFSLADGTTYNMQVQGNIAYVAEAASAPDLTTAPVAARIYRAPAEFPYTADSSVNLYAWGSGRIVCDEA